MSTGLLRRVQGRKEGVRRSAEEGEGVTENKDDRNEVIMQRITTQDTFYVSVSSKDLNTKEVVEVAKGLWNGTVRK